MMGGTWYNVRSWSPIVDFSDRWRKELLTGDQLLETERYE